MVYNASTSYYDEQQDFSNPYNQLVIEISNCHLVCMLLKENNQEMIGFEYFPIDKSNSIEQKDTFETVLINSRLLNYGIKNPHIYFNNEQCLPVPAAMFEEDLAADYVNAIYGDDYESEVFHDVVSIMPGFKIVYRVQQNLSNFLRQKFHQASFHHTYSYIIKRLLENVSENSNEVIKLQFYSRFFIASVIKNGELTIIQTYEFDGVGDVLFALLNMVKQFQINQSTVTLQLSGIIDPSLLVWEHIKQHFNHVIADEIKNPLFSNVSAGQPLYYFSPFINLVS